MRHTCLWLLVFYAFFLVTTPRAKADNIVSVVPTGAPGGTVIDVDDASYSSWAQTGAYANVSISAILAENTADVQGEAYLMNAVGSGVTNTATYVVASEAFSAVTETTPTSLTLFTGLTLEPGTYFLVVTSNGADSGHSVIWGLFGTGGETITTGAGDSINDSADAFVLAPFIPASTFITSTGDQFEYTVTGTPTTITTPPGTAPEPSSLLLLAAGLGGLAAIQFRRRVC